MRNPPEAYLIFREELKKQKEENRQLREEYETKLNGFSQEVEELRERLSSQRGMLENTIEYALKLEKELASAMDKLKASTSPNRSYH